jgi:50S ribosomal subunit-associated GTPase HflX
MKRDEYGKIARVCLSAHTAEGTDLLRQALFEAMRGETPETIAVKVA